MNSCLYEGVVMHQRFEPREYRFEHKVFMFYLDLDEIDELASRLRWMSRNRFNLYSFYDRDHLGFSSAGVRENIQEYLVREGMAKAKKIRLLTSLRVLGYVFNPVSFYFFEDEAGRPAGTLAEVGNTFGEMKPYLLKAEEFQDGAYRTVRPKYFYISPFMDLDLTLKFDLRIPGETLFLRVDDLTKEGRTIFVSNFKAEKKPLSDKELLRGFLRHPMMTLQVIGLIHWHAFRLFLKKIPHHKKEDNPHLQRDVYREFIKR